jgi:hypothetical protein
LEEGPFKETSKKKNARAVRYGFRSDLNAGFGEFFTETTLNCFIFQFYIAFWSFWSLNHSKRPNISGDIYYFIFEAKGEPEH